jgi:opacity protein-like surface antigen
MRTTLLRSIIIVAGVASLGSVAVCAESDIAASLYGAFSGRTTGDGVVESPSNSAGVLFEARHIANPLVGYEATYSYNRGTQTYAPICTITAPLCPTIPPNVVPANAHEIAGDWVVSLKVGNLRPFALAGAGLLLDVPSSKINTQNSNNVVYIYGAGLDWGVLPHLGVRFQYRGHVNKAPGITTAFSSTGAFAHTAEPMIGAYFRF